MCAPGINCHPAFVGYRFKFVPDRKSSASVKSLDVSISLDMEWSKEIPKPTDKDFLEVKPYASSGFGDDENFII